MSFSLSLFYIIQLKTNARIKFQKGKKSNIEAINRPDRMVEWIIAIHFKTEASFDGSNPSRDKLVNKLAINWR